MTKEEFHKAVEAAEGYVELGLFDMASDIIERLPSRAKITKEVITIQVAMLVKTGQPLKASYLAESLCLGEPSNTSLLLTVAQLRFEAGEFSDAINWLSTVEQKCSSEAAFHLLKAKCHASLGQLQECRISLTAAHSLDPELRFKSLDDPAFDRIFGADPNL